MTFDKNTDISKLNSKELAQYVSWLQAENSRLRTENASAGKLSCKVSDKGAVSVYGMGRFPVTLYREQWERLFAHKGQIEGFITSNASRLSTKEAKEKTETTPATSPATSSTSVPDLGDVPFGQVA